MKNYKRFGWMLRVMLSAMLFSSFGFLIALASAATVAMLTEHEATLSAEFIVAQLAVSTCRAGGMICGSEHVQGAMVFVGAVAVVVGAWLLIVWGVPSREEQA